jgi:predicted  nucleic acid-binding Zn-ribbon protein
LLIAAFEAEVGKYDERLNELTRQLSAARSAHEALSNQKFGQLEKAATLAEELAASNARVAQLEMEISKLRSAESQSESVLREKLRSSDVELKALREQVALLTESVSVQKRLLAAKIEEKEEVEYQWGEAKGRLAMREADYGQLEVCLLRVLAA